jgi:hypothetical protein
MPDLDLRILRDLGFTPELATELGHMCAAWAALEYRLFSLYVIVSNTPTAVARAAFYSHHNTGNRIDLLGRTATMVLRGTPELEAARADLDRLITSIGRTTKKRNAYIHDPWAADANDPVNTVSQLRLSGTGVHGEGQPVSHKDISQLTDQIVHWSDRTRDFYDRVSPLLPASHDKLNRTRSVTLAFPRIKRRRGTKKGAC